MPRLSAVARFVALGAVLAALTTGVQPAAAEYGAMHEPVTGQVTSKINSRCGYGERHDGIDIAAPSGRGVYAAYSGTVRYSGWYSGYGNTLDIQHRDGYWTRYAHLSAFDVRAGTYVSRGQLIGRVGNTGVGTGPHLHFEVLRGGQWGTPYANLNDAYQCGETVTVRTRIPAGFPYLPA